MQNPRYFASAIQEMDNKCFFIYKGFVDAIKEVIPSYDPFGETEVSFSEWKKIGQIIQQKDEKSKEIYKEADKWLEDVFKTNECFTILGL